MEIAIKETKGKNQLSWMNSFTIETDKLWSILMNVSHQHQYKRLRKSQCKIRIYLRLSRFSTLDCSSNPSEGILQQTDKLMIKHEFVDMEPDAIWGKLWLELIHENISQGTDFSCLLNF